MAASPARAAGPSSLLVAKAQGHIQAHFRPDKFDVSRSSAHNPGTFKGATRTSLSALGFPLRFTMSPSSKRRGIAIYHVFCVTPLLRCREGPAHRGLGLKELTDLRRPGESFIALGGLNASNAAACTRVGAEGIAVSSAIAQALDPAKEVRSILAALRAEHK